VTDAELAVLEVLWDQGPSTIREITDLVYPDGSASSYATVQKLLDRLETKRWVARRARGRANEFRARESRDELLGRRLRETADRLCGGSLTPLLTHLVRAENLSPEELDALRKLVERHDGDGGAREEDR
jgi:predicted transcriptional regulator